MQSFLESQCYKTDEGRSGAMPLLRQKVAKGAGSNPASPKGGGGKKEKMSDNYRQTFRQLTAEQFTHCLKNNSLFITPLFKSGRISHELAICGPFGALCPHWLRPWKGVKYSSRSNTH